MVSKSTIYFWETSQLEDKYKILALELEKIMEKWENQYKKKYVLKYGKIDYVIYPRRKANAIRSNKTINEIHKTLELLFKAVVSKKLYDFTGHINTLQGFNLERFKDTSN